ncbi:cytochrome c oxidase assembly protein [Ferroacidibacillus organovorans]|uniref:Cytochrome c oxidase assembly protein n=1 Tax=Ferroacidibacillus organovorans TaxID=1765683 RepID=A0A117SXH1_9BACL|nr:cytochrome c oxidase assembly protein [Ferroacidibacillus organovorans]KUO95358.1 hypothetical protein ATW55_10905 [Ferroacidibacillus organovorans]
MSSWATIQSFHSWRPDVLFLVLLLGAIYLVNTRDSQAARSAIAFFLGLILLYLTLGPLAALSERASFTAYILQMLLMTMALPWLLVFRQPDVILRPLLDIEWIHRLIVRVAHPFIAMVLFNALLTATLLPAVFARIVTISWIHIVAQSAMGLAAIFFWWPIANPLCEERGLTRGRKILYIVYSMNFMMPILVALFVSNHPWYAEVARGALQLGINPLADQQVGSVVMLCAMYLVYGTIGARIYARQDQSIWYE